jgi:hypothetical protein
MVKAEKSMNQTNNSDTPDNKNPDPPKESLSFHDLISDLGELPMADPKQQKSKPKVSPHRNRVAPPEPSANLSQKPKAIYDRPRPEPKEIKSDTDDKPDTKPGSGQPAAIFFDDDRRKAIQEEKDEETKRLEDLDKINSRVLGSSGYQSKPMWTTALLFAVITAALCYPNLSTNDYREMYEPFLSFGVVFFAGITVLVSASGILNEESWLGRILCMAALSVGVGAAYLVYPNIIG